jgi:hypothetical protein
MLTATGPICRLKDFAAVPFALSFTAIWKLNVPAVAGVPLIVPVAALRPRPDGNAPLLRDQVYGGVPPLAAKVWEYGVPTAPPGSCGLVPMLIAEAVMVRLKDFVAAPAPLSLTFTVKLYVPPVPGVPVRVPVLETSDRPVGNLPEATEHVYGGVPPLAAKVWEYGVPTAPPGSCGSVLMLIAGAVIVRVKGLVFVPAALSLTFTVKLYVPPVEGVPVRAPVPESDRPVGNVPEATDQVYGGVPPVAENPCE